MRETLTPRGVGQWLNARDRLLSGRRPIEVIGEEHAKAVRDVANAYVEGAYL